jgi:hypothetical protein
MRRRDLLRGGLAGFAGAMATRLLGGCSNHAARATDARPAEVPDAAPSFPTRNIPAPPALRSRIAEIGPLGEPDANGVRVAAGFRVRLIARTGERVAGSSYVWHIFPDGGATFATEDGGWIYVSNSEAPLVGGAGAVRFDAGGNIVGAHRILDRTQINCAGGKTPWHTWLSCEETDFGRVFECDPWGEHPAIERPALGVFKHEAAAVDPVRGHVYLTEDETDGRLYRFVPSRATGERLDLGAGRLEVAVVAPDMSVGWTAVPDPQYLGGVPTRRQVPASTAFRGGEGIWYQDGKLYFSTKGDTRIWVLDCVAGHLAVLYDAAGVADPILTGVDNVTASCCGDVLVAEDAGDMQVVAILPDGELKPLLQVMNQPLSEITGPAFDPSGTRLYFSSQRAPGGGATYEIEGPFHAPA